MKQCSEERKSAAVKLAANQGLEMRDLMGVKVIFLYGLEILIKQTMFQTTEFYAYPLYIIDV
ncbi:hypothetical protein ACH5RR_021127, partial [Cinchona calisaya]